ncbi:hypothetical protein CJF31_00010020 [Rutstroemia sp. NJR-2017a BVV2]|nr:hypothetical protein CJF31_00010020 [Rutstroemia sp. NJR-2017a BVV2]
MCSLLSSANSWEVGQSVQTTSGLVHGHAASNTSVSEYLGIPYAEPPIGTLRFEPPQKYTSNSTINGTDFGFSCPVASTYSAALSPQQHPTFNFTVGGIQILDAIAQVDEKFSEDCLTLNIWTKPQTGEKGKAVMVWIPGGGFVGGSPTSVAYNGQYFADQEDVIIVSVSYRLNIFGFPGNPLGRNNLGLLDQRLAVQWVHDNIAAFGGDPSRITLFGESAGGASVDLYSYGFVKAPLVAGFIAQSGTTQLEPALTPSASANLWFTVSSELGCGNSTSDNQAVLACMRNVSTEQITKAVGADAGFIPTADDIIVFSNYTARSLAGNFTKKPMLVGHTDAEANLFALIAEMGGETVPDAYWASYESSLFFCPAAVRANVSVYNDVPVWRYRYFGDYPNMQLQENIDAGAYHGSEVFTLFGNTPSGAGIPAQTLAEKGTGDYMRKAWAAFAKDPENGLTRLGWPAFDPEKNTLIRLGYGNSTGLNLASSASYDAGCTSIFPV